VLLPRFGVVVYKTYFNKIKSKTSVKLRIEDLDLGGIQAQTYIFIF